MRLNFKDISKKKDNGVWTMDDRKKYEVPQFGFNVGFKVGFKVTNLLTIECGLEYSSVQYLDTNNSYYYNGFGHNYTIEDLYQIHTRYNYHYINIPVGLKFSIGKKKVQCAISTGIIFNGLTNRVVTTYTYQIHKPTIRNKSNEDTYKWANINVSPYLGIGIDYHINKLLTISLMPIVQMQTLKAINEPITEYHWIAGFNTCLLFSMPQKK